MDWFVRGIAMDPCHLYALDLLTPENLGESSSWDTTNQGSDVGLRCKNYLLLILIVY